MEYLDATTSGSDLGKLCWLFRFLELWWNATWLYLIINSVVSAVMSEKVAMDPTLILLCIAMVLVIQNMSKNQKTTLFTVILGVIATLLSLPEKLDLGSLNPPPG